MASFMMNPPEPYIVKHRMYYLPDRQYITEKSIIHKQVGTSGIFGHPVVVLEFSEKAPDVVRFVPLTTFSGTFGSGPTPAYMRDQYVAIEYGSSFLDTEEKVPLAPGSAEVEARFWASMKLFEIEAVNLLCGWKTVEISEEGIAVFRRRLGLEEPQNPFRPVFPPPEEPSIKKEPSEEKSEAQNPFLPVWK